MNERKNHIMSTRQNIIPTSIYLIGSIYLTALATPIEAQEKRFSVEDVKIDADSTGKTGQLTLIATIKDPQPDLEKKKLIYTTTLEDSVEVSEGKAVQRTQATVDVKNGKLESVELNITGEGEILGVEGESVKSWSVRSGPGTSNEERNKAQVASVRALLVEPKTPLEKGTFTFTVRSELEIGALPAKAIPLAFAPLDPALFNARVSVSHAKNLELVFSVLEGLRRVEPASGTSKEQEREFIFQAAGKPYRFVFDVKDTIAPTVAFEDFQLVGVYDADAETMHFSLAGTAAVFDREKASLELLGGAAALTLLPKIEGGSLKYVEDAYQARFEKEGRIPIRAEFDAKVDWKEGRGIIRFGLVSSPLRPVTLRGLPVGISQVELGGAPIENPSAELVLNCINSR
jgi:hypothetical protein